MLALTPGSPSDTTLRVREAIRRLHHRLTAAGAVIDPDDRATVLQRLLVGHVAWIAHLAPREVQLLHQRAQERWKLSGRQSEILRGLVAGRSNRDLSSDLGIAVKTVEAHVSALLVKANAESRLALVAQFWSLSG